ncbi:MAG: hypothetical protein DKM23_01385 [Candidatus Melainabacteria bacterium]|jgi:DNA-binding NarL/FixJ family response regulator|nr:MAG: hypothetical protein DKM24_01320 [Candidatus Melainabacteria bacterium]RAI13718.1 MAG: hypothetical protein DKM23_01385 [Candidatus Melainabacteria bacterium]
MDENKNYHFTERELEILKEVITGKNNTQIANDMCLSIHTIKFYVSSILAKLSVTTRLEAAVKVVKEHLLDE